MAASSSWLLAATNSPPPSSNGSLSACECTAFCRSWAARGWVPAPLGAPAGCCTGPGAASCRHREAGPGGRDSDMHARTKGTRPVLRAPARQPLPSPARPAAWLLPGCWLLGARTRRTMGCGSWVSHLSAGSARGQHLAALASTNHIEQCFCYCLIARGGVSDSVADIPAHACTACPHARVHVQARFCSD